MDTLDIWVTVNEGRTGWYRTRDAILTERPGDIRRGGRRIAAGATRTAMARRLGYTTAVASAHAPVGIAVQHLPS